MSIVEFPCIYHFRVDQVMHDWLRSSRNTPHRLREYVIGLMKSELAAPMPTAVLPRSTVARKGRAPTGKVLRTRTRKVKRVARKRTSRRLPAKRST